MNALTILENDDELAALPVACSLDADALDRRGETLRADLFRHAEERQDLPDGVRFRFPGTDAFRDKLLAFVVAERTCCAFFRMELAFEPGLGPIWLTLSGPEGVKAFVQERFDVQAPASAPLPGEPVPQISRDDLWAHLARGAAVTLVETLPEPYFRKAHLPGAINIPAERVSELAPHLLPDRDAAIVVYCADLPCPSSAVAARALMQLGYRHVRDYAGGKQDWLDAGLPTERTSASATSRTSR